MSAMSRLALLAVVFVDLMGQGLLFPIISELVMSTKFHFLPSDTPQPTRHLFYGIVISSFFLAWFLGSVYVAKLSDSIGRKSAMVLCLVGALAGYTITIVALFTSSLWLLILGRVVSGFTAGNQPIAQAAMIDASRSELEASKNLGLLVAGMSAGAVAGPIIAGVLADQALLGNIASIQLPFYFALLLVAVTLGLILAFYHDSRKPTAPVQLRFLDLFRQFVHLKDRPQVVRLCPAYLSFMLVHLSFYIFITNYLNSRFQLGLLGTSMAMLFMGIAVGISSIFLVKPVLSRWSKPLIIKVSAFIIGACALVFAFSGQVWLCYVSVFIAYLCFGLAYPALLHLFAQSVDESEQGWVMGIATAGFTIVATLISLLGGGAMEINIRLPFFITALAAVFVLILIRLGWRSRAMKKIIEK
ncbi:MFS transporter [Microbulbifer sp. THAF38]|uniref:MFS transporter n=1 Tax=Microbulbifer sp. THAF38 TaxID=2587856 RepID=UPI0012A9B9BC|nr:MFS transporter [Microbulbifer sp. THAF38]QFT54789.1 Tetracycline resistance protein, class C [Microbulbifer sp. THAF38]